MNDMNQSAEVVIDKWEAFHEFVKKEVARSVVYDVRMTFLSDPALKKLIPGPPVVTNITDKIETPSAISFVALTGATDEEIYNPPAGIRCTRLRSMGRSTIAISIIGDSPAARELISHCGGLPATTVFVLLPEWMRDTHRVVIDGYGQPRLEEIKS